MQQRKISFTKAKCMLSKIVEENKRNDFLADYNIRLGFYSHFMCIHLFISYVQQSFDRLIAWINKLYAYDRMQKFIAY